MIKIILTLFVIVSSASFLYVQGVPSKTVNWEKACEIIENNATIRIAILKSLTTVEANATFAAAFPNTTAYIKTNSEKLALKASVSECLGFFEGLKTAIIHDARSDHISLAELKKKIEEFMAEHFGQVANLF